MEPQDLRDIIYCEVYKMAETYGIVEPMSQEDLDAFVKEMEENHPELYDKKFPQDVYLGIR